MSVLDRHHLRVSAGDGYEGEICTADLAPTTSVLALDSSRLDLVHHLDVTVWWPTGSPAMLRIPGSGSRVGQ